MKSRKKEQLNSRQDAIQQLTEELCAEARAKRTRPGALEDKVYDMACEGARGDDDEGDEEVSLEEAEERAGRINSEGLEEQVTFILSGFDDLDEGKEEIRRCFG